MSSERYDIVLYGASGFTGLYVLEALVKTEQFQGVKFAVAGRSQARLQKALNTVSTLTGNAF